MVGLCGRCMFYLLKNCHTSPVIVPVCIPTSIMGFEFSFSTCLPLLSVVSLFHFSHSNRYILHRGSILISLMTNDVEHLLLRLFAVCKYFLVNCVFKSVSILKLGCFLTGF